MESDFVGCGFLVTVCLRRGYWKSVFAEADEKSEPWLLPKCTLAPNPISHPISFPSFSRPVCASSLHLPLEGVIPCLRPLSTHCSHSYHQFILSTDAFSVFFTVIPACPENLDTPKRTTFLSSGLRREKLISRALARAPNRFAGAPSSKLPAATQGSQFPFLIAATHFWIRDGMNPDQSPV